MNTLTIGLFRELTAKIEHDAGIEVRNNTIEIVRYTDPEQVLLRIHLDTEHVEMYVYDFMYRLLSK